ncbi:MAG TPA: Ig-like domain-containing protein [Longimicrobiaceae bacterium]|nr:Ig-like domain-containing protein [Longimicrobiaceae bacterium]
MIRAAHTSLLAALGALLLCLPAAACDDPASPEDSAARVSLSDSTLTLFEGRSDTLAATVLSARGVPVEKARVRWSSSDTSVAVVDSTGVVTARQMGTTRVAAAFPRRDGSVLADSATVVVRAPPADIVVLVQYAFGTLQAGQTADAPIRFQVLDRFRKGVPGVSVRFELKEGALSATSAVTDSLGAVETRITRVPPPGSHMVLAFVEGLGKVGVAILLVDPPLRPVLSSDSVVVSAPGCVGGVIARLFAPDGQEVFFRKPTFTVLDTTVAQVKHPEGARGQYVYQFVEVEARRAGTTRLIASYHGLADTIPVRVASDQVKTFWVEHNRERAELALDDSHRFLPAAAFTACGITVFVKGTSFRSSDERVATVAPDGTVTARGRGTTQIVGTWRDASATLTLDVREYRMVPADTTVAVGDTVRYRLLATDASGVAESIRLALPGATGTAVEARMLHDGNPQAGVPAAIAVQPGESTVSFQVLNFQLLNWYGRHFSGKVRVVERTGG